MRNEQANENTNPASLPEKIWATLDRTSERLDRNAEQLAEHRERLAEDREQMAQLRASMRETDRQMQETDRRMQETDRQMKETDRRMQETDRQMKETDRRLKKAEDLFTTQWGRLMESLVEGDLVPLLKQRGIPVERTLREGAGQRNGESFEVDILAINGREVVVVEVKTTLRSEGVTRFLGKLDRFLDWSPEYRNHTIHGAVAYLRSSASVVTYAERQGLFVIRATGNSASIVNAEDFVPRAFP